MRTLWSTRYHFVADGGRSEGEGRSERVIRSSGVTELEEGGKIALSSARRARSSRGRLESGMWRADWDEGAWVRK